MFLQNHLNSHQGYYITASEQYQVVRYFLSFPNSLCSIINCYHSSQQRHGETRVYRGIWKPLPKPWSVCLVVLVANRFEAAPPTKANKSASNLNLWKHHHRRIPHSTNAKRKRKLTTLPTLVYNRIPQIPPNCTVPSRMSLCTYRGGVQVAGCRIHIGRPCV